MLKDHQFQSALYAYIDIVVRTSIAVMAARNGDSTNVGTHEDNAEGAVYAGIALANVLQRMGAF